MEEINQIILACDWFPSNFFFFSKNVFDPLVYYSHLFPVILSLIVGGLVYFSNRKSLLNKSLFVTVILFSLWSLFDLVLWATPNPLDTMFFWSMVNIIEPMIYLSSLYFIYIFINNRTPSLLFQTTSFLLIIPAIFLGHTTFNIVGFNLTNCDREAVEGILVYYNYFIEIIFSVWIIVYGVYKSRKAGFIERKQIILATIGLTLFLLSFSFGNIVGSISENWIVGQLGLFGLPIFIAFLAILVGRYHSFKTKTSYAEILVIILWALIVSMLFIRDLSILRLVLVATLLITFALGASLIKSVRRQINQRQELEILNEKLKRLDVKKDEFLSFATHQLRSPLTSIKWGLDSIKTKYNPTTVEHLEYTVDDLIGTVNDLLDISKIEQGDMDVKKEEFDLLDFLGRIVEEFRITAEKKGLKLLFEYESMSFLIEADQNKLRQVFVNLIDNAIKYTKEGKITVSLKYIPHRAVIDVADTGPGISEKELSELFDKFLRGSAGKASQSGSGLGLYLAKKIVQVHDGTIVALSPGIGKGSTFRVELPMKK